MLGPVQTHWVPSDCGRSPCLGWSCTLCLVGLHNWAGTSSLVGKTIKHNTGHPSLFKGIGTARNLAREPDFSDMTHTARGWLDTCMQSHSACDREGVGRLPTRVIQVGSAWEDPKLYISQGEEGHYLALSHCWGGGTASVTTKNNLETRTMSVPLKTMARELPRCCSSDPRLRHSVLVDRFHLHCSGR